MLYIFLLLYQVLLFLHGKLDILLLYILIFLFLLLNMILQKVMLMLYFKSLPFLGPFLVLALLPPNPPPKNDEKISPKSPKSENPSNPDVEYE